MAEFKKFVKKAYTKVKTAAKKRYTKKGGLNVMKIAKDVMKMTQLLNVEKKYQVYTETGNEFSLEHYYATEVTPVIPQGVTANTRTGNSVKLVSARLDVQIKAQANMTNQFRYKWYLVRKPDAGPATSPATVVNHFLEPNIFNGLYDVHSQRDPEFFKNYRVVAQGSGSLRPENLAGQMAINQWHKNLKLDFHLKFDSNQTVITTENGLYLIFVGDTGDNLTPYFTGASLDLTLKYWYVDN